MGPAGGPPGPPDTQLPFDQSQVVVRGCTICDYEARVVESLGADCIEKNMTPHHLVKLEKLLQRAGIAADPKKFKRYGSARKLYNFHVDNVDAY